jgi:HEAT repeat protein
MKATMSILVAAVLIIAATTVAAAADTSTPLAVDQYARAEQNLLIGIESDNQGLKESSAYLLGEFKSAKAVVPLMKMLRSDEQESARIVAALALCRIGDARGVYAVKRATQFDNSERVAQRCAWFYNEYVRAGAFEFAAVGMPDVARMATR